MLTEQVQKSLLEARKQNNKTAKNVFSVLLGDIQKQDPKKVNDNLVINLARKMIEANKETASFMKEEDDRKQELEKENLLLSDLIPKCLSIEEMAAHINRIKDQFVGLNKGAAMGTAIKYFKAENLTIDNNELKQLIDGAMVVTETS